MLTSSRPARIVSGAAVVACAALALQAWPEPHLSPPTLPRPLPAPLRLARVSAGPPCRPSPAALGATAAAERRASPRGAEAASASLPARERQVDAPPSPSPTLSPLLDPAPCGNWLEEYFPDPASGKLHLVRRPASPNAAERTGVEDEALLGGPLGDSPEELAASAAARAAGMSDDPLPPPRRLEGRSAALDLPPVGAAAGPSPETGRDGTATPPDSPAPPPLEREARRRAPAGGPADRALALNGAGYRAEFSAHGATLSLSTTATARAGDTRHRPASAPAFASLRYRLARVESGKHLLLAPSAAPEPRVEDGGIVYEHSRDFTERYENRGVGIEQTFLLRRRPPLEGDLVLVGELTTSLTASASAGATGATGGIDFAARAGGEAVLRYGAATAIDAAGRSVACANELKDGRLSIRVPEGWLRTAEFPVLVDPLIGPNFQVTSLSRNENNPAIAYDSTLNRYAVAFERTFSSFDRDILAQLVAADGTLIGGPVTVTALASDERVPKISFSPTANRYLVVWEQNFRDIRARVLDANLAAVTSSFFVDRFVFGFSAEPDVVYRSTGDQWCVAWTESGFFSRDLFASTLTTGGKVVRNNILLRHSNFVIFAAPDLAYNATLDEFFLAFEAFFSGDLFGFGFDGGVSVRTTQFTTISKAKRVQKTPAVVWNSLQNEYFVAYASDEVVRGDDNILGQRIEPLDANLVGAATVIATQTGDERDPDVDYSPVTNSYAVVWHARQANGTFDVFGQEVQANGTLLGGNFAVSASPVANSNELFPAVRYNSVSNQFGAVWMDGRNAKDFNLFGQRFQFPF